MYSAKNGKEEGFLHNIPKDVKPFEVVHIDHYSTGDKSRSFKHILVIVDPCTKFVRLYTTKTTNTREVVKLLANYFRSYGRPKNIVSDRGTCFTSNEFQEYLESNNIQHIKIATGSPQANGQVERINRSIGPMIAKLVDPSKGRYWDTVVEDVEFAINNTIHRSIKEYPSVMFGVKQRGKIVDDLKEALELCNNECSNRKHEDIRKDAKKEQ